MRATSIYGAVYLIFIIIGFFPGQTGSPVSTVVPFEPFDLEQTLLKLLFLLFLIGYFVVRKHEGIGGAIFILWWLGMWGVEVFITAPIAPDDWGIGIVAGSLLFVLGILFMRHWYKNRRVETVPTPS